MSLYVPTRRKMSLADLADAPDWGKRLNEISAANAEDLARAIEQVRSQAVQTLTVTVGGDPKPTMPLVLTQAKDAKALWVGACVSSASGQGLATALAWRPGGVVTSLGISEAAVVTFCWLRGG